MSNPFAVAAVTATFRQLLLKVRDESSLAGTDVSMLPPDMARSGKARQLNLFLYQISPNGALRNAELPVRTSDGTLVKPPVLALDLHYVMTAYGLDDSDKDAQHLMAHAMSLVHDNAIFTRPQIQAAITGDASVAASDLADQIELIKLSPQAMTTEDLFKLWSAFQTHYRLSVGYEASVVLVQRPHRTTAALPVREAGLYVLPFQRPKIEELSPQSLTAGAQLTVRGRNLKSDVVKIRFGTTMVDPDDVRADAVQVTLPTTLFAGINAVQVVQPLLMGKPPALHRGFESNVAAFVLVPQITTAEPISVARGSSLTLSFDPPIGRSQQVTLLIGDQGVPLPIRPPTDPPSASSFAFPIPSTFPAGTFLLRVQVDGAESALRIDAAGAYNGPQVTVT